MSKVIFGFIGPAGSGKSTQALLLAETLACGVLNIGEELRASSNKELIEIMKSGELVPDSFIFEIIEDKLKELKEDDFLVLDGFFRRASGVRLLAKKERALHLQIGAVLDLRVSEVTSLERLKLRARVDDSDEGIKARLSVFEREREEVLASIKQEDVRVIEIDGEGTIDEIRDDILDKLGDLVL